LQAGFPRNCDIHGSDPQRPLYVDFGRSVTETSASSDRLVVMKRAPLTDGTTTRWFELCLVQVSEPGRFLSALGTSPRFDVAECTERQAGSASRS
jgi:hypothetical protein